MRRLPPSLLVLPLLGLASAAQAEDAPRIFEKITVTGSAGGAENVAGSVTVIPPEELERLNQSDILRIIRIVPGLNIQEEEGYGLRPNIGLRGSGSDRSARVSLIEDGVPIAPAPYAAPAAYYFPSAGRIHSVEVTKGPASIKYGPRTTGGAVNVFSTPIPETASAYADFLVGDYGRQRLHAWAGTRAELAQGWTGGVLIETYQDEADGFLQRDSGGPPTGFDVSDYVIKTGLYRDTVDRPWQLEFKYQTRREGSEQTYLGLTDEDFNAAPFRLYDSAQLDRIDTENELFQITHRIDLTPDLSLTTLAYRHNFARNWFKMQGVRTTGQTTGTLRGLNDILRDPLTFATEFDLLTGATSLDNSLVIRNNKRAYYSEGLASVISWQTDFAGFAHDISAGIRLHRDEEDRFQKDDSFRLFNGQMLLTASGAAGSQDNRIGSAEALSVFIEDRITIGQLQLTGGLRFEDFDLKRTDYSTADPSRAAGPTRVRETGDSVVIPAATALYRVSDELSLLAGVHRGYAPQAPGVTNADAERSWNYEAGARFNRGHFNVEAIAYLNAYSNLVGTCTASTGAGCQIGDQFNGGEVDVMGLEVSAGWDAAEALGLSDVRLPLQLVYTWSDAEFKTSFVSSFGPWGNVTAGDQLPYISEHQLTLRGGIESGPFGLTLSTHYQDDQRAFAGRGAIPATDLIGSRWVTDAAAYWDVTDNIRLKIQAENLFDETYVASRLPAGVRPGKPREILAGVSLRL